MTIEGVIRWLKARKIGAVITMAVVISLVIFAVSGVLLSFLSFAWFLVTAYKVRSLKGLLRAMAMIFGMLILSQILDALGSPEPMVLSATIFLFITIPLRRM